jgi:SAM-dependent methyltransferase
VQLRRGVERVLLGEEPWGILAGMATPWDRAAAGYVEEWVPRFVPYHLDLIHELALAPGQRVLVPSCGPGSEVLAAARAVGDGGRVRATDKSTEMVRLCGDAAKKAGFACIDAAVAEAGDASGGPWDAIVCAFGLWQLPDRVAVLRRWESALGEKGKVGILTWGPPDTDDPFETLARFLSELEPGRAAPRPQIEAERDRMTAMFDQAGLVMVRHTVVRHVLSFRTAEAFVNALREGCTWRRIWEELGDERLERIAAKFYDTVGGPDAPLSFAPPATLAIAARPGAEVELAHRPSLRVPTHR